MDIGSAVTRQGQGSGFCLRVCQIQGSGVSIGVRIWDLVSEVMDHGSVSGASVMGI